MYCRFLNLVRLFVCIGFCISIYAADSEESLFVEDPDSDIEIDISEKEKDEELSDIKQDKKENVKSEDEDKEEDGDNDKEKEDEEKRKYDNIHDKAFPNKIIFSETPEIGRKWRGGIRFYDLFAVGDLYWNIADFLSIDATYASAGFLIRAAVRADGRPVDSMNIKDNFLLISAKSRPFVLKFNNYVFKAGGGLKYYRSASAFLDEYGEGIPEETDQSVNVFTTSALSLNDRLYLNLFLSGAFRTRELSDGETKLHATIFAVPGGRVFIGKKKRWSFGMEYYLMNPEQLPIKTIQYTVDEDNIDFYNPDRKLVSFLFWGFSYSSRKIRIDLNIGSYSIIYPPYLPFIGFGWNF